MSNHHLVPLAQWKIWTTSSLQLPKGLAQGSPRYRHPHSFPATSVIDVNVVRNGRGGIAFLDFKYQLGKIQIYESVWNNLQGSCFSDPKIRVSLDVNFLRARDVRRFFKGQLDPLSISRTHTIPMLQGSLMGVPPPSQNPWKMQGFFSTNMAYGDEMTPVTHFYKALL